MQEESSNFFEETWEDLKTISRCPICNSKYTTAEIDVLERKEDAHLVCIKCKKCQASVIAVILANQLGVSSVGLVTDLNGYDILKFKNQSAVSFDDVIEIHQMLEERGLREKDLY
jgi:transcription elongation factor Elf1